MKGSGEEMTDEERRRIKAQLIELGLWDADELGDPTSNVHDAGKLHDCLQAKLAKDVFLVSRIPFEHSWGREIVIFHIHQEYKLAAAPTYIAAISLAALALPEFLRRHRSDSGMSRRKLVHNIGWHTTPCDFRG